MNLEEFVTNIMDCHREALNNPEHACHDVVKEYQCEPFRFRNKALLYRIYEVKVMFLGLSPGIPEEDHKPYTPKKNAKLKEVMEYLQKPILNGIDTNFRNAMKDRIGSELEYVKANVVHVILDKGKLRLVLKIAETDFCCPWVGYFAD